MPLHFEADYADPSLSFDALVDEVLGEPQSSFLESSGVVVVLYGASTNRIVVNGLAFC